MISVRIKQYLTLCMLIVVSFFLLIERESMVNVVLSYVVPLFLVFLLDDGILYMRKKDSDILKFRFNCVDLSLLILFLFEIMGIIISSDWLYVQMTNNMILSGILVYFFCRIYLCNQKLQSWLVYFILFLSFKALYLVIANYLIISHNILSIGFSKEDIIPLRFLFLPGGMFINIWSVILLAFLPFYFYTLIFVHKFFKPLILVAILGLIVGIVFTFSRGAILSLSVFLLLTIGNLIYNNIWSVKRTCIVTGICIISTFFILYPAKDTLNATFNMDEQSSQVRSAISRVERWRDCFELFKKHPFFGIGAGNYPLKSMVLSNQTGTAYHHRVENTFIQLLVEKGIIGTVPYFIVLLSICYSIWLKIRNKSHIKSENMFVILLFFSSLIILLLRESTFSILFANSTYFYIFSIIVFLLISRIYYETDKSC